MPRIATVGLVGGFWEDGAIGDPEEPAGFRRKLRACRVLRAAELKEKKAADSKVPEDKS